MKGQAWKISVRIKVAFALLFAIGLLLLILLIIGKQLILESYLQIEYDDEIVEVQRFQDALTQEMYQVSVSVRDWSHWDDTYTFIEDRNGDYAAANLGVGSISNLEINAMVFIDAGQNIVYANLIDLQAQTELPTDDLVAYVMSHKELNRHDSTDDAVVGIANLSTGPYLIASRPILTSEGQGPAKGALVFAKALTPEVLEGLSQRTHLKFTLFPYTSDSLPLGSEQAVGRLLAGSEAEVVPLSSGLIAGYSLIKDFDEQPIFLSRIDSERQVYLNGLETVHTFSVIFAIFCSLFWLLVMVLMEFFFLRNIINLSFDLKQIRKQADQSGQVRRLTRDEIGDMAQSINGLLLDLQSTQTSIKETNLKLGQEIGVAQDAKKAVLNLLEDLEEEKSKIEETVKVRTQELSVERARLAAAIQSLQLGFIMFSASGDVLIENRSVRSILGVGKQKITLQSIAALFSTGQDLDAKIKTCIKTGQSCQFKGLSLGDRYLDIFMNTVISSADTKGNLGAVLLIEDVTAAKAMDKAKTEFVSTASHQLRTPLSTANWYLELLSSGDSGELNPEQKTFVAEISKSAERMVVLVNTLLDASRLELGTVKMELSPTNLSDLVKEELKSVSPKIAEQKIKIIEDLETLPPVNTSAKYFGMVVQNLISNALKYTPEGGTVTAHLGLGAKGQTVGGQRLAKNCCVFSVADTGFGIPKKQQDKIFDRFFRADNVLDKDEPGTGLGLYIVKSIVESLMGQVWFESTEGQGTVFYVTIPMKEVKKI